MNLDNIYFILVEPQLGENIGAVGRVMSNFGFSKLRIVSPRDGWPNPRANELAANGEFVVNNAEIYDSLKAATDDLNYLVATSAQLRVMEKRVVKPPVCVKEIKRITNANIGIMLGRESSGLTNEEIILADLICHISTSKLNLSLNIAQAACIMAYEISKKATRVSYKNQEPATKGEIEQFFQHLKEMLDENQYFKVKEKEEKMFQNIRNIFIKAQLSEQEVRTLRGIIKSFGGKG